MPKTEILTMVKTLEEFAHQQTLSADARGACGDAAAFIQSITDAAFSEAKDAASVVEAVQRVFVEHGFG